MAYVRHEDLCGAFKGKHNSLHNERHCVDLVMLCVVLPLERTSVYHYDINEAPPSAGETLLAIRAPTGTQLEVPVPEPVSVCVCVCVCVCGDCHYKIELVLI